MSTTICNYCKSKDLTPMKKVADLLFFPEDIFTLCRCNHCGLTVTTPALTEQTIQKYYPDNYGAYYSSSIIRDEFEKKEPAKVGFKKNLKNKCEHFYGRSLNQELHSNAILRFFLPFLNGTLRYALDIAPLLNLPAFSHMDTFPLKKDVTRVLYIGSGNPQKFAKYQKDNRITLTTIDINKNMCEEYNHYGIQANYGTISSVELVESSYDVIFFTHVLEHLLHPKEELQKLQDWLSPTGTMVCAFPDYGTWEWKLKPTYYDVPRHQIHLTHKTARMIFKDAKLKILKRLHPPYGSGLHHRSVLKQYMKNPSLNHTLFFSPPSKKHRWLSFLFSLFNQSGNVIYYLGKEK